MLTPQILQLENVILYAFPKNKICYICYQQTFCMRLIPFDGCIPKLQGSPEIEQFIEKTKEDFDPTDYHKIPGSSFFIYRITAADVTITGLVCQVIDESNIIKHETVIPAKSKFIASLIEKAGAVIKPIMAFYPTQEKFTYFISTLAKDDHLIFEIHIGEEHHQVFKVPDEASETIQNLGLGIQSLYIADGHHRYQALAELTTSPFGPPGIFSFIYDASMVYVKPYNRGVQFESREELERFSLKMDGISSEVKICPSGYVPQQKGEVVIVGEAQTTSYLLHQASEEMADIDYLNKMIFEAYVRPRPFTFQFLSPDETVEKLVSKVEENELVLMFYPITAAAIMETTSRGTVFPPKSTWFYPKVRSGIIASTF